MVSPRWLLDGHSQGRTSHPMKNTSKAAVLAEVEAMSRPQLSLVETVDEETGEILTAKAFVRSQTRPLLLAGQSVRFTQVNRSLWSLTSCLNNS